MPMKFGKACDRELARANKFQKKRIGFYRENSEEADFGVRTRELQNKRTQPRDPRASRATVLPMSRSAGPPGDRANQFLSIKPQTRSCLERDPAALKAERRSHVPTTGSGYCAVLHDPPPSQRVPRAAPNSEASATRGATRGGLYR